MNYHKDILVKAQAMKDWLVRTRRDLHEIPEQGDAEFKTQEYRCKTLEKLGIPYKKMRTAVVGIVEGAAPGPVVALRADMDALPITEVNDVPHKSTVPGKMHACGHDGHTTMLLGAARYLAETRRFRGTVRFIFQPAEEGKGGGREMVKDGLFEKLPVDTVYGMHNWPGMRVGTFAVKPGPMMGASDDFDLLIAGRGGHGAMPHLCIDPVAIGAEIVGAFQTIVSRTTHPVDSVVVSVTNFHAGEAYGVIPETALLRGTVRTFRTDVQDAAEAAMRRIADGISAAHGASAELTYVRRYPATINHEAEAMIAAGVAGAVVGEANVDRNPTPTMGAEDFSFMLNRRPGCYIWAGSGEMTPNLHSATYDFNDDLLPIGASYWAQLAETVLK